MPAPLDFYFDFISPYAHLGAAGIEALAARHGRTVAWHPVLLGVTVMQVMGLKPLMETPLKSDYVRHDKPRMAKWLGVQQGQPAMAGVNSVNASRAFLWLRERDPILAVRFAHRVFDRLWVRGLDITAADAVVEEAAALGVEAAAVCAAIATPEAKAALRAAVDAAVARGVFGTPYVIADGEPFWGVDRFPMLEHWLAHQSWDPS